MRTEKELKAIVDIKKSKVFDLINMSFSHAAIYIVGLLCLIIAYKISPTSLASPGLDALIFLLLIIAIFYFLMIGCFDKGVPRRQRETNQCIHVVGIVLLIAWMMNS